MTDRPFGVNVMLMSPHAPEVAKVILEEKVPVVTTGAGLPGVYMKEWVPAGIKVVPVVPSVPSPSAWRARARPPSSPRAANPAATWAN